MFVIWVSSDNKKIS